MALIVAIVVLGSCSNNKKSNSEDKTTTPTIKTKDTIKTNNELATKYLSTEDFKKNIMNMTNIHKSGCLKATALP